MEHFDTSEIRSHSGFVEEEFLAEDFLVDVQPHFNSGEPLRFISQECGPFDRRSPISVPLWVALYLERHGKCSIVCPEWLSANNLRQKLKEEREKGAASFSEIQDHMIQVAFLLLNRDHLPAEHLGGEAARNLMGTILTELLMVRRAKMADGLKQIDVGSAVIDISNMSSMERALVRPQTTSIMDSLRRLWTIREDIISGEPRGM